MEYKYIKPLESTKLINEFEKTNNYVFCNSFKRCVTEYNGGRPYKQSFKTEKGNERTIKSFLSFNKEDKETIWQIYEWNKKELKEKYIPFGIDNFGNLICFDENDNSLVFINHEDTSIELIAKNFDEFINELYE